MPCNTDIAAGKLGAAKNTHAIVTASSVSARAGT
jgi:hypothetical protein